MTEDLETQLRMHLLEVERALETLEASKTAESNGEILAAQQILRLERNRLQNLNQALRLANSLLLGVKLSQ